MSQDVHTVRPKPMLYVPVIQLLQEESSNDVIPVKQPGLNFVPVPHFEPVLQAVHVPGEVPPQFEP